MFGSIVLDKTFTNSTTILKNIAKIYIATDYILALKDEKINYNKYGLKEKNAEPASSKD